MCFQEILSQKTQIGDPFEQAFFILVHSPYLQPFEDVDGVSRGGQQSPKLGQCLPPHLDQLQERAYGKTMAGMYEKLGWSCYAICSSGRASAESGKIAVTQLSWKW